MLVRWRGVREKRTGKGQIRWLGGMREEIEGKTIHFDHHFESLH